MSSPLLFLVVRLLAVPCRRFRLVALAVLLLAVCCRSGVAADTVIDLAVLGAHPDGPVELVEAMQVLQEPRGAVSDGVQVLHRPGWRPASVVDRNASWKRTAVWLTGEVTNRGPVPLQTWVVVRPWRIETIELMALDPATGRVLAQRLAGRRAVADAVAVDQVEAVLPLALAPGQTVRLLIRADDLSVPTTHVSAWTPSAYQRHQTRVLLREAVMLGVALALTAVLLCSGERGLILLGGWLAVSAGFEATFNGRLLPYLLPAIAAWIIPLFTLFGALGTSLFALTTTVLLGLHWRRGWAALMLGNALLTLLVALATPFVVDHAVPRQVVNLLGFVGVLLWPLAAWRSVGPLDAGRRRLRGMLTLCCAALAVYVILARGGVQPAWAAVLQDWLRLDRLAIVSTILVHALTLRSTREAEHRRTEFLAFHDALTGLPNRVRARERLHQALDRLSPAAVAGEATVAVLYLDLDKFKQINDTHGHAQGDRLLREVAARLTGHLRRTGVACRLSGDEFMVIVPDAGRHGGTARHLAQGLLAAMALPFALDGVRIHAGASIGLAIAPLHGHDAETLMRHADIALYAAKRTGERQLSEFAPPMLARLAEQVWLRDALHRALARGEFALHYQPQRRLGDGRIVGVEALLRWQAPHGPAPVGPARLVEVAEECGLIEPIGAWVLHEACRQAQAWPHLTVAVNVSALQFRSDRFVDQVEQALAASALAPHRLELELTESVLIGHDDTVPQRLRRLRALGVRLAIDDFGTGYSGLSYLQRFQVDRLKIDRTFVERMEQTDGADAALVTVVVQIARQFGFETVAEGVESPASLAALARLGCDIVQGYAVARPMPAVALAGWLADQDRADAPAAVAPG